MYIDNCHVLDGDAATLQRLDAEASITHLMDAEDNT